jgi:hypothetical protein
MATNATNWTAAPAPGIRTYPHTILRAMRYACRVVDLDIERTGTVSVESVEAVRDALEQIRQFDAADAMHPDSWTPEFFKNLPAAAN